MTTQPVIRLDDVLLVSLHSDMGDEDAIRLQDDIADRVASVAPRGVLLDLSAVEIIDSFLARVVHDMAAVTATMDAVTVVVGIRPAVAITMAELGLDLGGLCTALTVDAGLRELRARDEVRDRERP
ncbi:STAS domain-containing protein [Gandjariella thermophila]|uniref:Anti-sigma factor antagonist n=1 Tax=Gandjariella thermophila TaxID=1931992 RepID=A0A4D4J1J9_9PSEU|nr:STAS domain-containing protein [Gandjariella thermophila]GDY28668.1 anti-sigma factor antagonist [Gandjariella thermophila]